MGPLDQLVETHPLPSWRGFAWTIMFLIAGVIGWAFWAELDEVTIATGTVVPKGDLKVVQHLEGGIISAINVREGSNVKKDDVLLQLDVRSSGLKREEIEVSLDRQLALRARLEAETTGKEPEWPKEVLERRPDFVRDQRRSFADRNTELRSTLRVVDQQIRQKELAVRELRSKQKSDRTKLGLAKQRLEDSAALLKQQLVARVDHLTLEAEVEDLESGLAQLESTIPRTQAEVYEAKARKQETLDRFRRESQEQLGEVREQIAKLTEELSTVTERGARLDIKSPIAGVVKSLRYTTIGGVVRGGEPIMEIVPVDAELIINAKLNPKDVGFVTVGDPARVKLSTYDFVRYGALEGRVTLIAADATEGEGDEQPYFQLQVETEKPYLGKQPGQYQITAGMQATVDIHTGKRTVIDFLIRPVLKIANEFGRER